MGNFPLGTKCGHTQSYLFPLFFLPYFSLPIIFLDPTSFLDPKYSRPLILLGLSQNWTYPCFETFWLISPDLRHILQNQFLCWNHSFQLIVLSTMKPLFIYFLPLELSRRIFRPTKYLFIILIRKSPMSKTWVQTFTDTKAFHYYDQKTIEWLWNNTIIINGLSKY